MKADRPEKTDAEGTTGKMERSTQDDVLSPREREIARAYADGDTYHRIAERLFIAPSTVRTHLATIYRKLGVSSKLQLHKVLAGDAPASAPRDEESAALISELALSLEEAVSRERALGEVLKIISGSNGKIEDVIAAVLGYALELCDAEFGILIEYDPALGYRLAYARGIPEPFRAWMTQKETFPVGPQTALGRMAAAREVVNVADVRSEGIRPSDDPLRNATIELGGARSFAAIPMLAGDRLIGAFVVYRQQVRPFDEKSLELARIFADQSVIAIENARLIGESRGRRGRDK